MREMQKKLSEEQFKNAVNSLNIGDQTLEIAYGVLVDGKSQVKYAKQFNLTKGAISQAVNRVWVAHHENDLPTGYEKVSVILPERQAYIVNKWAQDAAQKLDKES